MTMLPGTSTSSGGIGNPKVPGRFNGFRYGGRTALPALLLLALSVSQALPEPVEGDPANVHLELNSIGQQGAACSLTFVALNKSSEAIEELAFEFVLFDQNGLVQDMKILDFGALPTGKTVVKRFRLKDKQCASVSRLLVNGAARCKTKREADFNCIQSLVTGNRTNTEFGL